MPGRCLLEAGHESLAGSPNGDVSGGEFAAGRNGDNRTDEDGRKDEKDADRYEDAFGVHANSIARIRTLQCRKLAHYNPATSSNSGRIG